MPQNYCSANDDAASRICQWRAKYNKFNFQKGIEHATILRRSHRTDDCQTSLQKRRLLPLHPKQESAVLRWVACGDEYPAAHSRIRRANHHRHLPLLEVKRAPLLRRHSRPLDKTQRASTEESRLSPNLEHLNLELL